jgi:transposase
MGKIRKQYGSALKAKIALEAIKEIKTINELAAIYQVHRVQICKWKKELLEGLTLIFERDDRAVKESLEWEKERDDLYRQIGEVTVERDWLKKKLQNLI